MAPAHTRDVVGEAPTRSTGALPAPTSITAIHAHTMATRWPTTMLRTRTVVWPGFPPIVIAVGPSATKSQGCLVESESAPVRRMSAPATAGIHTESEVAESALPLKRAMAPVSPGVADVRPAAGEGDAPTSGVETVGVRMGRKVA